MAEFIHSVLRQDENVALFNVESYDLPVNPLSHILLTLKTTHTAAALTNVETFAEIMALIEKIEVLYKGSAIYSMSGYDAFACGIHIAGFECWGINWLGTTLEERSTTWCIPLGRRLYNPRECFPRSTRGELILQVTYAALPAAFPTEVVQIETVELPNAAPERFLRMTTLSADFTQAGDNDIDLPIGNPISDLVIYGETIPAGVVETATVGYVQVLVDNMRRFYSHTNYETLHNMAGRMRAAPGYWGSHVHEGAAAAALAGVVLPANHVLGCYVHVPFDVLGDGQYILQTAGKSDVTLRIGCDAAANNEVRVIPCEIVSAGAGV